MTTALDFSPTDHQAIDAEQPPPKGIKARIAGVALQSFILSGAAIASSAVSGIVTARVLGTSGRGALTAITVLPVIVVWILSMGARQAISFFVAKRPHQTREVLSAWVALGIPLAALSVGLTELVLPWALASQSASVLQMARLYMPPMVALGIYAEILWGTLLGTHRFSQYNIAHAIPPLLVAGGYAALAVLRALSVGRAVIVMALSYGLVALLGTLILVARQGLALPRRRLIVENLIYGAKAHTMNVSATVSGRLDLTILPALLTSSSVGLYAVATNLSWIVVSIAAALAAITLPLASARSAGEGDQVLAALHFTLLVGTIIAITIAIVAPVGIRLLYGSPFAPATTALRILLPGCVLMAASSILGSGLCAANKPLRAGAALLPALLITIVGLPIFIPVGGIDAAAAVSTTAYTSAFVASLLLYRRVMPFSAHQLLPSRSDAALLLAPLASPLGRVAWHLRSKR